MMKNFKIPLNDSINSTIDNRLLYYYYSLENQIQQLIPTKAFSFALKRNLWSDEFKVESIKNCFLPVYQCLIRVRDCAVNKTIFYVYKLIA